MIPGLTAACSGGALVGAPLTHDFAVISTCGSPAPPSSALCPEVAACLPPGNMALLKNPISGLLPVPTYLPYLAPTRLLYVSGPLAAHFCLIERGDAVYGTTRLPSPHVRLAHPDSNGGARILRRGYNFVDGSDGLGQLSAGLFFISYQRSPEQFVRIQRNLAGSTRDALNEYVRHVGSALFAVPPGVRAGRSIGEGLFG